MTLSPLPVYPPLTPSEEAEWNLSAAVEEALDPRDPDPSRSGIFRDHNCSYCHSGDLPCVQGHPHRCEYPHARND